MPRCASVPSSGLASLDPSGDVDARPGEEGLVSTLRANLQQLRRSVAVLPADGAALPTDAGGLASLTGLQADPWQRDLLLSRDPRMILNCCRQSGKSTVTALIALFEALAVRDSLILLLAPALRQAGELLGKIKDAYRALGPAAIPLIKETELSLTMANRSRIVCLPGKEATIRGFSGVTLLIVDEASRVPDALYMAVRPMLAVSGGRLILLSTPWGKRGFFHREWTEGGRDWHRVRIDASQCPRISPAFLEEERRALGTWWFNQEYLCLFEDNVSQVFATELVLGAASSEVLPLFDMPAILAQTLGESDQIAPLFEVMS